MQQGGGTCSGSSVPARGCMLGCPCSDCASPVAVPLDCAEWNHLPGLVLNVLCRATRHMFPQANLQLVVNIAKEYTEQLGSDKIIAMLESYNSYPGLYLYLGSRIAFT